MGFFDFWPNPIVGFATASAILLGILLLIFWIWMIVDCAKRRFRNGAEKIVWILVIILLGWIGALVYFIVIKSINYRGIME